MAFLKTKPPYLDDFKAAIKSEAALALICVSRVKIVVLFFLHRVVHGKVERGIEFEPFPVITSISNGRPKTYDPCRHYLAGNLKSGRSQK